MGERTVSHDSNMAIYCDFENVALGARDAGYGTFDMGLVLQRLLDKGKIVVKKAYSDWNHYESAKKALHEVAFELIEVPHVSMSGKNSADIRLVVDALDLCYTKAHIDLFVIVSGDSDFSPLVNKLRENDKAVIGVGVKNSSSHLLIENCDEFIYYDDLVREKKRRPKPKSTARSQKTKAAEDDAEALKVKALDMVLDTADSLLRDRGGEVYGSMVKQVLKRKRPNFSESFHGYSTFTELLRDAEQRGLLQLKKDTASGGYIVTGIGD